MKMNIGFKLSLREDLVYSWDEVEKYGLDEEKDKHTYCSVKVLNYHKPFLVQLYILRKEAGIPEEGYSISQFQEFRASARRFNSDDVRRYSIQKNKEIRQDFFEKLDEQNKISEKIFEEYKTASKLLKKFTFHPLVLPHILTIFFANFACLNTKIQLDVSTKNSELKGNEVNSVIIKISRPITQNELVSFVKDNWKDIEEATRRLSFVDSVGKRWSNFNISERDFKILDLHSKGLSFPKIADQIGKLYEDRVIDEDQMKTAYHEIVDKKLPWIIRINK